MCRKAQALTIALRLGQRLHALACGCPAKAWGPRLACGRGQWRRLAARPAEGRGRPGDTPPLRLADARPCGWGFRRRATAANASRRRARIHAEAVSGVAEEPAHARPDAGQRCAARHAGRLSAPWQTAGGAFLPKTGDAAAAARPESEGIRQSPQEPNKNSNYSSLQIAGRRFRQLCRA